MTMTNDTAFYLFNAACYCADCAFDRFGGDEIAQGYVIADDGSHTPLTVEINQPNGCDECGKGARTEPAPRWWKHPYRGTVAVDASGDLGAQGWIETDEDVYESIIRGQADCVEFWRGSASGLLTRKYPS